MGDAPVLQLSDASVVKNGVRVLNGLTLTIRAGQHTAILGPNGAGKTALIHLLTHDHYPLAGADGQPPVQVFGADTWVVSDLRRQIGVVSDERHRELVLGQSAGHIRADDAVISGFFSTRGGLRRVTVTPEMRDRAAAALARLGAEHLSTRYLDEMSTGEARRVLIARALVTDPRALVLDEPTAGLDIVARSRFLERVRHIARQGTTLVVVTHHVEEIVPEIHHVVLLKRGRVLAAGSKRSLLTSESLTRLFDEPVTVKWHQDGYHSVHLGSARRESGNVGEPGLPGDGRSPAQER